MAYVGRGLNQEGGQYRKLDSISSNFDGSEVSFNLTIDGLEVTPTAQNLLISLGGVIQEPGTAFSVDGSTITFASAPDSSASFFGVLMGEASFIARGTVGAAEMGITAGAVTASAGIVVDSAKNLIGLNNLTATLFSGDVSGSSTSTGSFGSLVVPGQSTLGVTSATSLDADGGVTVDNITIDGTEIDLSSGNLTLDVEGNIILDANGAQIRLEDDGTEFGRFSRVSSDLVIKSISNNNDMLFKGVDNSATITALTLDMSEAGNASFNNDATFGGSVTASAGTITGDFSVGGTLTAQEVHTEFESASILFTSGSTQFGNSSDDVHDFKGNTISGSITSTGSFGSIETKGTGVTTFNGGNVGVGTTAPTVQLEVFGSADQQIRIDSTANRAQLQFDGKKTSDAEFAEINFANDGDSAAAIHAMRDGANDAARLVFFTQATGGSVTERMSVDSTGNVGIGTDNPNEKLHVEGSSPSIRIKASNEGGEPELKLQSDQGDDHDDLFSIRAVNEHALNIINFTGDTATSMMFISGSGQVGIGTTQPDAKLKVEEDTHGANVEIKMRAQNDSGAGRTFAITADPDARSITMGEAAQFVIKSNGATSDNVGIGVVPEDTNTNYSCLQVGGNGSILSYRTQGASGEMDINHNVFYNQAGNYTYLSTDEATRYRQGGGAHVFAIAASGTAGNTISFTEKMRINNDGVTVGGGASPQRALHVQGATGLCLSDGDRDRAAILPVSPDANTGHMAFNTRSGATSRERMRLTSTGNLCVGPSGSSASFTPALTVTGTNPSLGLRLQDGNSGTFYNTVLNADGNAIKKFYSQQVIFATAANDGGTSEAARMTLDTSGNLTIAGSYSPSDINLKTNIEELPDVLNVLNDIKPIRYKYKRDIEEGIDTVKMGLIAQEVEKHFPELILENSIHDTEEQKFKSLNYNGMIPILLKAVQELSSNVNELQQKIEELEK